MLLIRTPVLNPEKKKQRLERVERETSSCSV